MYNVNSSIFCRSLVFNSPHCHTSLFPAASPQGLCGYKDRDIFSFQTSLCQINICHLLITCHLIHPLLPCQVKPGRAVRIIHNIFHQMPFALTGIIVHIIQLLLNECIAPAFLSLPRSVSVGTLRLWW